MNKHTWPRSSKLALQAASVPIGNRRFMQGGLLDGLTSFKNRQNRISACIEGMPAHVLPFQYSTIHNCRLSIDICQITAHCTENNRHGGILPLPFSGSQWVGTEKMAPAIFSVLNLTKARPWIEQNVNRGFLATALRKSGIDVLGNLWHSWPTLEATSNPFAFTPVGCGFPDGWEVQS